MKRTVSILLAVLVMVGGIALAEAGLANPWMPTTAQGLMDALGLQLGLPEGATDVTWRMLEEAQMGEMAFTWQGMDYTARAALTDEFEDISGMDFAWETTRDCEVGRCGGVCRRAHDGGNTVELCLWYDELTGVMYSVSTSGEDLDGFDITAAAQILYIPLQTE
jgi:hypothetical protein